MPGTRQLVSRRRRATSRDGVVGRRPRLAAATHVLSRVRV